MQTSHDVTLIWSTRDVRPSSEQWCGEQADRWPSLGEAIRFATAMLTDKAASNLFPWIWTPSGHVYSPHTIAAMGQTFEENRRRATSWNTELTSPVSLSQKGGCP